MNHRRPQCCGSSHERLKALEYAMSTLLDRLSDHEPIGVVQAGNLVAGEVVKVDGFAWLVRSVRRGHDALVVIDLGETFIELPDDRPVGVL